VDFITTQCEIFEEMGQWDFKPPMNANEREGYEHFPASCRGIVPLQSDLGFQDDTDEAMILSVQSVTSVV
jgi:hypothetical protein